MSTPAKHLIGRLTDDALIQALVAGKSVTEAAADAKCSVRTANRRMLRDEFRRRLAEARSKRLLPYAERVDGTARATLEWLQTKAETGRPASRVRAAVALIEVALKLQTARYLELRLLALEHAVAQLNKTRPAAADTTTPPTEPQ